MSASLAQRWARTKAEPGLGRDVRVLIATVVAGVLVGGYVLFMQRVEPPWTGSYTFAGEFQSVPAVSPGNGQEVRIAGVPVGSITKASVTDAGTAKLTMKLDEGTVVYKDAKLLLRPKSPLNEMYVEMDPGTAKAGKLREGGTIAKSQTAQPVLVDEVLGNLDKRSRDALSSLLAESDVALAHAQPDLVDGIGSVKDTVVDLKPLATALQTRRDKIARLVTDVSRISQVVGGKDQRLAALANDTSRTLATVSSNNDALSASLADLPGVVDELGNATSKVDGLADELTPTLKDVTAASKDLPPALRELTDTVESLRTFSDKARPVIADARPVVAGLRPVVRDLNTSLRRISPITAKLDQDTALLVPYLVGVQDFFYNTMQLTTLSDANGGIFRGIVQEGSTALPVTAPGIPAATSRSAK
ncbi:MAG: hypothetical protein JWN17_2095 [Frankiales bacterium]|nr:hypothetical protein [Frankiales bacterium]